MERLIELLKGVRDDVDFENETSLIDDEILDSFDVVAIIGELNDAYGIDIAFEDMTPENFNSVEAIYALVRKIM